MYRVPGKCDRCARFLSGAGDADAFQGPPRVRGYPLDGTNVTSGSSREFTLLILRDKKMALIYMWWCDAVLEVEA